MNIYKLYLGGMFEESETLANVNNPFNEELVGKIYLCNSKQLNEAINLAEQSLPVMRNLSSFQKQEILLFIANEVKQKISEFATMIALESAKPMRYAIAEVNRVIQTFLVAAEECKRLPNEYISLDWTPAGQGKEGFVKYFPVGIVAGISPFNFPLNLAVHKIAPAIAAGCPIVLKPASQTPISMLMLAEIIDKSNLPKGALSVLPMSREVGTELVKSDKIKLLSFTGSDEIGWKLKALAGKKKSIMELGGNAATIITKDFDFVPHLEKLVISAFAYSGQICIHAQRFYVHESVYDSFVNLIKERTLKLVNGNPLNEATDVSVVIDSKNAQRLELWINEAVEQGAQIICGGKRLVNFIEPTILTNTNKSMKVNSEEVFGPIICVEKFSEFKDAIEMVNDSRYGLQCSVFTNSIEEERIAFNTIETGSVLINEITTFRVDHMPYGGLKDSGQGREGVRYAMLDMLEPKLLIK